MNIFAPWDWVAKDWEIQNYSNDSNCAVAAVPVLCNEPHMFCYRPELHDLDLSRFDLVVLSDIEFESISTIKQWIQKNHIQHCVLALGGKLASETLDHETMMYRPWWCYNLLKYNTYESTTATHKPYMFDALLGARRPHRDYVMLCLQHYDLLKSSIATYRDIFHTGGVVNHQSQEFANIFHDQTLAHPYVSSNLDPNWEVSDTMDKSISPFVPWHIYRNTWYSLVTETIGTGNCFFLSEKTTKCLFAGRLFVMFSNANFLQGLRNLGFETFGSVLDESYDQNTLDFERFKMAFEQIVYLSKQNPVLLYKKLQPILEHNRHKIWELKKQTQSQQQNLLCQHLPTGYVIN